MQINFRSGSGSGSGLVTLNQRTIALNLTMLDLVARGRYGEVRRAIYRGSIVAVKVKYLVFICNYYSDFSNNYFYRLSTQPKKNHGRTKGLFIKLKC